MMKLRYAALNVIIQTVLQVIVAIVNYFSAVLNPPIVRRSQKLPFCSGVPGSRKAGSPLSSALNSGDVSQCKGQPTVRHTQI